MKIKPFLVLLCAVILMLSSPALAQQKQSDNETSGDLPEGLDLVLGGGVGYAPEYLGSDDYQAIFLPLVKIVYQDTFFLTTKDGLGVNLIKGDNYTAGLSVTYSNERDDGDDSHINGMGDIDWTLNGGAFAIYEHGPFFGRVRAHHDLLDEHDGILGDISLGFSHVFTRQLKGIVSVEGDFGSEDFMQTYFGVDALQSLNSGLSQYSPDAGFYRLGLNGSLIYKITPGMFVQGTAGFGTLIGDAADSPVVEDENQFFVGSMFGYMF